RHVRYMTHRKRHTCQRSMARLQVAGDCGKCRGSGQAMARAIVRGDCEANSPQSRKDEVCSNDGSIGNH
ncbi:MAG: hypothetical protein FWD57_09955, partial [Polyangiaceae bacterium]|nr:hypothetical protein [Polyangiaceae bacterium]